MSNLSPLMLKRLKAAQKKQAKIEADKLLPPKPKTPSQKSVKKKAALAQRADTVKTIAPVAAKITNSLALVLAEMDFSPAERLVRIAADDVPCRHCKDGLVTEWAALINSAKSSSDVDKMAAIAKTMNADNTIHAFPCVLCMGTGRYVVPLDLSLRATHILATHYYPKAEKAVAEPPPTRPLLRRYHALDAGSTKDALRREINTLEEQDEIAEAEFTSEPEIGT